MRTQTTTSTARGYMLVEALVYISAVMVLVGVGYVALYKCINNSLALRRSADDISRALSANERWRQDVRNASVVRHETAPNGEILFLESNQRTNAYLFAGTNICRSVAGGPWLVVLPNVKASVMEPLGVPGQQSASQIPAGWIWNFELFPRTKSPKIRPLFTCSAVATGAAKQP